jgi:hypothetical protein
MVHMAADDERHRLTDRSAIPEHIQMSQILGPTPTPLASWLRLHLVSSVAHEYRVRCKKVAAMSDLLKVAFQHSA